MRLSGATALLLAAIPGVLACASPEDCNVNKAREFILPRPKVPTTESEPHTESEPYTQPEPHIGGDIPTSHAVGDPDRHIGETNDDNENEKKKEENDKEEEEDDNDDNNNNNNNNSSAAPASTVLSHLPTVAIPTASPSATANPHSTTLKATQRASSTAGSPTSTSSEAAGATFAADMVGLWLLVGAAVYAGLY